MTSASKPPARLTSLLRVEERLLEAEYFGREMFGAPNPTVLGYQLNAFLAAARSVTFLLHKQFAAVPGFKEWWSNDCAKLGRDEAARFFLELRNHSQKEGPVSVLATSDRNRKWRYMFAGTAEPVPVALLNRDVADCCLEHLGKLALALLRVADAFPYHSCAVRALTPEGIAALGLSFDDVDAMLAFPPELSAVRPEGSIEEISQLYRRYADAVDFDSIRRIAEYEALPPMEKGEGFGNSLGLSMVEQIEDRRRR